MRFLFILVNALPGVVVLWWELVALRSSDPGMMWWSYYRPDDSFITMLKETAIDIVHRLLGAAPAATCWAIGGLVVAVRVALGPLLPVAIYGESVEWTDERGYNTKSIGCHIKRRRERKQNGTAQVHKEHDPMIQTRYSRAPMAWRYRELILSVNGKTPRAYENIG